MGGLREKREVQRSMAEEERGENHPAKQTMVRRQRCLRDGRYD